MPWIAWSLFCLNRWNRLSPLSHYHVVKGPGFGWTYPIWNYDCIARLDELICQPRLMYVSLSADLDISVNVRWTVGTYLLCTYVCRHCLSEQNKKEGRASDLSTKKLSVSLTLALARLVTGTWIFRCDTQWRRSCDTMCSLKFWWHDIFPDPWPMRGIDQMH